MDANTLDVLCTIDGLSQITNVSFNPDGTLMTLADNTGTVTLWKGN